MSDKTLGERMATVEAWVAGHEERCEERLGAIGRELRDIKTGQATMQKTAWALLLAIAAWGASQVYADLKRPDAAPATVVAVNPAPAPQPAPIAPR
ncbi:hypothetical protein [Caulobacter hibisci]|uniref:DUF3618 domain-containing protein n=1 Tax=Caulobacter hibisci TaxID=2035993 RepID=A0ABS0SXW5_9CAUL|nr:hypothetical protein [Caulobacter hibisci]MBI1684470.1 hypothetical protein [Caulobacter hibisci]